MEALQTNQTKIKSIIKYDRTELAKNLNCSKVEEIAKWQTWVHGFLSSVQSFGTELGVLEIIQFQQKLERCQIVALAELSLVINFPGR